MHQNHCPFRTCSQMARRLATVLVTWPNPQGSPPGLVPGRWRSAGALRGRPAASMAPGRAEEPPVPSHGQTSGGATAMAPGHAEENPQRTPPARSERCAPGTRRRGLERILQHRLHQIIAASVSVARNPSPLASHSLAEASAPTPPREGGRQGANVQAPAQRGDGCASESCASRSRCCISVASLPRSAWKRRSAVWRTSQMARLRKPFTASKPPGELRTRSSIMRLSRGSDAWASSRRRWASRPATANVTSRPLWPRFMTPECVQRQRPSKPAWSRVKYTVCRSSKRHQDRVSGIASLSKTMTVPLQCPLRSAR
mmetsp:Transcript_45780/g.141651  ORF Transcript_45780/g.141651 Transcript_45780/m.141651 type:complete len:314 (-) Transcript_45780:2839-3780(-)